MRFTMGLRWRTVKVRQEKTQSFIRRLGFFSEDREMFGDSHLKLTALISLAIHLLIIALVSGSFRNANLHRPAFHRVRVTLLPLAAQEKPKPETIAQNRITLPVPLRVGNRDQEEASHTFRGRGEEPISLQPSAPTENGPEKLELVSKNGEEEESLNPPVHTATHPGSALDPDSNYGNGGNGNSGELSGSGFSYIGSGNGPGTPSGGGSGSGSGPGSGDGSPGAGGSGKGTGISNKYLRAHGGGNGAQPRYAQNPKPAYPREAREKGYEGEVILRVEVLPNGRVGQIEVKNSSGYELLDRSALAAVRQWKFVPAKNGETPIPLWVNIPVKFQLQ
jgi:TonB family protein